MILEKTEILKVSHELSCEDMEKLSFAADIIRRGGTVCFPTETVYGLGANALDGNAVSDIFKAKGRPQDNPLIIHLDSIENAVKYTFSEENPYLSKLSGFFPGPITAILKKRSNIPDVVTSNLDSVGVRIPSHPVANAFLKLCGVPVAAPSANISGKPSPSCAEHVIEDLDGKVDVIISSGHTDVGLESTIITLVENPPVLLRPGGVTYEQLKEVLGDVGVSKAVLGEMQADDVAFAPGMKYKHYAPGADVFLVSGEDEKAISFLKQKQQAENCAILAFSEDIPHLTDGIVFDIGSKNNAEQHAHRVFELLRETDKYCGLDAVYVHITNDKSGLNLAVFNRLLKASAFRIINV